MLQYIIYCHHNMHPGPRQPPASKIHVPYDYCHPEIPEGAVSTLMETRLRGA